MFDKVFKTSCKFNFFIEKKTPTKYSFINQILSNPRTKILQHSFPECGNAKLLCLEKSVREIQPNKFQTGNYKIIFHA